MKNFPWSWILGKYAITILVVLGLLATAMWLKELIKTAAYSKEWQKTESAYLVISADDLGQDPTQDLRILIAQR